jgi:hypothetical protein
VFVNDNVEGLFLAIGVSCRTNSRMDAMMGNEVISQAEADERILTFDIPDAALERTASTERQAFTWIYCTGAWQYCPA